MGSPKIVVMNHPDRNPYTLLKQLSVCHDAVVVTDTMRKGALHNAISAFTVGVELGGPVTILQDDVEVCINFLPYMAQYLGHVERHGTVIQWFMNGHNFNAGWDAFKAVLHERTPDQFLSTQAVTYPHDLAVKILAHLKRVEPDVRPDDLGRKHGDDMHIRDAMILADRHFYIHVPALVQHIGEDSLVAPGLSLYDGFRQSKCYVGRGFDALNLTVPEPFNWKG